MKHLLLSSETVLLDNYPVYYNYVYIADMKIIRNTVLVEGTVGELKNLLGLEEVRRCDIFGHGEMKIGDEFTTNIE